MAAREQRRRLGPYALAGIVRTAVRASIELVRRARQDLDRAAASLGTGSLAEAADNAAAALLVFEHAWVEAREYADKMHNGPQTQRKFAEDGFRREYSKLIDSRGELVGMSGELRSAEIAAGGLAPDGLLARLRRAAAPGPDSH